MATQSRILVVDDDPVSQAILIDALSDIGRESVCASSGEEAWSLLRANPDLRIAFIDWLMPGMDGLELCRKIKAELESRYVYAIMITSKNQKRDLIEGLGAGADDFISKPIHPGELISRMHAGERVLAYERKLEEERERSDRLLTTILPAVVADRLKAGESNISDFHEEATILFLDIVGFTEWCMRMEAKRMIAELGTFFTMFDEQIRANGVEKIKSIGDAYMVAAGLPEPRADHAQAMANLALDIREKMTALNADRLHPWSIRMGINSGPVIAGVVGVERFVYDVWGHTVNLASRLESFAPAGGILIGETTRDRLKEEFECKPAGNVSPKGLQEQPVWCLVGRKPAG